MNDPIRMARNERDFDWFAKVTLGILTNCYVNLKPGTRAEDFIPEILHVVGNRDDSAIENVFEILMQFVSPSDKAKGPDWIAQSPYGSIIVSCAYCLRAMRAFKAGDQNLAWSYMADARYWCGVSISSKGIAEASEQTRIQAAVEARQLQGRSGADGRNKPYDRLRAYVYEEARKPEACWESRSYAAEVISKKAMKYVDEEEVKAQAEGRKSQLPKIKSLTSLKRTLEDSWLKDMPDASSLFAHKKSKS